MGFDDSRYEGEESYRASWERAVNGSRSRAADARAAQGAPAWGARRMPSEGANTATAPNSRYKQPVPLAQQVYSAAPHQAPSYQATSAPAAQAVPAPTRKGKRRATGFYTFVSWVALFAWAAFIYYMSSHTSSDLAQGIFAHIRHYIEQFVWTYYGYVEDPVSPICHFGEYFILGALLGNALHCHMPFIPATLLAIAVSSGYGYTDEIHQLSVAGRMFDMEDWKIDTIAAAIGSLLMTFFYLLGSRREPVDDGYR